MATKHVSATEARVHFGEVLRKVAEEGAVYVVERNGEAQAVVLSAKEYERLGGDPGAVNWVEALRKSQAAFAPFVEAGNFADPVDLIREGRENRDQQIHDAVFGR